MPTSSQAFRDRLAGGDAGRFISDARTRVDLASLAAGATTTASAETLRGKSVLLRMAGQLPTALAAIQLDGIAQRLVFCPPDLAPAYLATVMADAAIDIVVTDSDANDFGENVIDCKTATGLAKNAGPRDVATEWLLFTSGTTGRPKMVVHTLNSLAGPLTDTVAGAPSPIWSTFYDIRRYGGMQILLRALLGGGSLVLSDPAEPVAAFLARAGEAGVSHISGTPSHWRRALMSGARGAIAPEYVRLSGEVADQSILDHLAEAFPNARVSHAFASTEAGVGFDVPDGLAGFPAGLIGPRANAAVELAVQDGSLRLRSARTASHYVNAGGAIADTAGFVDTGDMVERRGERYYFVGRREGIINVGGQKVHPEEVEAVVNTHPAVRMSRVRARHSPITGALVVADLVLRDDVPLDTIREEIFVLCRGTLSAHKIPTSLRQVAALEIGAAGKLSRVA